MSGEQRGEAGFFSGRGAPGLGSTEPRPARRQPSILRRPPVFAVLMVAAAGWLLATLWPDVAFYFSARSPIDLGGPGAYRLGAARDNRLVQIRGELVDAVPVAEVRTGAPRTVGRLAGTNLLVDRPGRGGPPVFEGRLLPADARGTYGEVARLIAARGAPLGDAWRVLRDGEHPRGRALPVVGAALLAAVLTLNLWALFRALFPRAEASR
jgi:hypothetical protein